LIKTKSDTVQLAAPHASVLAVDVTREPRTKKLKKKAKKDDEPVGLVVRISRGDRKRLRRKAATYGWTADEAAAHVLRVWSDTPSA
jgi:hypothetical protein